MQLTEEESDILAGAQGAEAQRALQFQIEVGRFFGAERFVPITNAHMMGDIEVLGDAGPSQKVLKNLIQLTELHRLELLEQWHRIRESEAEK